MTSEILTVEPTDQPADTLRVLLVDDQPMVGEMVRRTLSAEKDVAYHYCQDPVDALKVVEENAFTVILLDLTMPQMSGLELLRHLQQGDKTRDTPVIVLSAKEEPTTKAEAFAEGASDYLVKLPEPVEFVARIRRHSQGYIHLLERRRSERALQVAEASARAAAEEAHRANQAKSTFLANISHEIRTPMNAILGYAQILQDDEKLTESQLKAVKTIEESGEHLLELINDVLDISKIEAGRDEVHATDFELAGLIRGLGAMFEVRCRQKRIAWRLEQTLPSPVVHGDANKLRQVLINLLGNAVKFCSDGEVMLQVRAETGDRCYFEVCDTGPGISLDRQAHVFEPFHQGEEGVRQGGTGLGLAIAREHVVLMGGTLELESQPGKGPLFLYPSTPFRGCFPAKRERGGLDQGQAVEAGTAGTSHRRRGQGSGSPGARADAKQGGR